MPAIIFSGAVALRFDIVDERGLALRFDLERRF
jgi:hypothetical protein